MGTTLTERWLDPPGLGADLELDVQVGPIKAPDREWFWRLDNDGFAFENCRCRASADYHAGRGDAVVLCSPGVTDNYAVLNCIAAAAHAEVLRRGGALLHGATLCHRNRAYVALGHSGAGKSTLANRFADTYLHDDYAFVVPDAKGRWWFWRHAETRGPRDDRPWRVPLGGLLILSEDRSRTATGPIASDEAFAAAFAHTFHAGGAGAQPMFAGVQQLIHDHPPWRLSHSLDDAPQAILEALEAVSHGA